MFLLLLVNRLIVATLGFSSIDFPFCRWETYIATSAATLSWFSCVKSKLPDTTFFAATITTNLPTSSPSTGSAIAGNHNTQQVHLSTGAIIGISVGGGLTLVGVTAIIAYWCLRGRDKGDSQRQELSENAIPAPMIQQYPTELDSRMYTRSELNSTTAYSPHSQPTTPFSPPEGYSGNREEFESWRRGVTDNPVAELQARKSGFFEHIPREVNREQHVTRNSWGEGDDREHMSPGTAY
ncbi:hypothetical protein B0J11DRAFT_108152 [Dendryphion nanum]|uniref:Uncharacterized protein n=1 Tax=Dendryphion nanum TaxID=256645 RepID=A0A9P9IEP1_9PLEO|nr:hypothetical protein B0J11DRAFT_108152 [Dendryphion nanum]